MYSEYCISPFISSSTKSINKRAINGGPFKPDDIYIPSDPKEVDGNIVVEFAVVTTSANGTPVVVPGKELVDMIKKKATDIGRKLGATFVGTRIKSSPIKKKPTSETRTKRAKGQSAGLIAGVTVAVGLLVIITAIAIWYFRLVTVLYSLRRYTFIFTVGPCYLVHVRDIRNVRDNGS